MMHSFDTDHAEKYGIIPAIILQNIVFWISKNKANEKHFHENRFWTYNSVRAMAELFPYLTSKQVRNAIDVLKNEGVILTGNYSENKGDRSTWYALVNEDLLPSRANGRSPSRANAFASQGKSSISTDIKPDVSVANAPDKQKVIDEKVKAFKATTYPFIPTYGKEMLIEFCEYWGEPAINSTKLRWEMEKTWHIAGRLARWKKNDDEKKAKLSRKPFNDPSAAPTVLSSPESYHQPKRNA